MAGNSPAPFIMLLMGVLLCAGPLVAQNDAGLSRVQMTKDLMARIEKDMEVDSLVQDSIHTILRKFTEQMKEYKEAGSELKKALVTSRDEKIKAMLGEDEFALYLKIAREVQEDHLRALRQKKMLDRERGNDAPMQYRRNRNRNNRRQQRPPF